MTAPARIHRLSPTAYHLEPLTNPATAYVVRAALTLPNGRGKTIQPITTARVDVNVNNPDYVPKIHVPKDVFWVQIPTGLSIDLAPNMIALIQPVHDDPSQTCYARPGVLAPGQNGELVITMEIRSNHRGPIGTTIKQGDPIARLVFQEVAAIPPIQEEGIPDRIGKAQPIRPGW